MSVRVTDPFGFVELGRTFHATAPLTVTPRTVPLPNIPLGGAWTGSGDNRPAGLRDRQRRGRDRARVPPRRRPAPGPLAQLGPRRRADGAARGAALAVPGDGVPRQPRHLPPRPGRGELARGRGLRGRLDRGPPDPPRLHGPAGHRLGRQPRDASGTPTRPRPAPSRCSRRWPSSSSTTRPGPTPSGWPSPATAACSSASSAASATRTCRSSAGSSTTRRRAWPSPSTSTPGLRTCPQPGPGSAAHLTATGWRSVTLGPRDRLDTAWQELGRCRAGHVSVRRVAPDEVPPGATLPQQLRPRRHRAARGRGPPGCLFSWRGADRGLAEVGLPAALHRGRRRRHRRPRALEPARRSRPSSPASSSSAGCWSLGTDHRIADPDTRQHRRVPAALRRRARVAQRTTPRRSRSGCRRSTRCCSSAASRSSLLVDVIACTLRRAPWPGSCCWRPTPCRSR